MNLIDQQIQSILFLYTPDETKTLHLSILDLQRPVVAAVLVETGEPLVPGEGDDVAGQHVKVGLADPGHLQGGTESIMFYFSREMFC